MIRALVFVCLTVLFSLPLQAATHYQYEKSNIDIHLEKDFTFTQADEVSILLLDEEGVKQQGQQAFYYNSQFDKLTILSAYTLKPNGQKIAVDPKKGQFDQPLPVAALAPMYTEARQISVIFPNLAVGDRIVYRIQLHRHTPLFPGAVDISLLYPRSVVYQSARINLTVPKDLPLFFDVSQLSNAGTQQNTQTIHYQWTYHNPKKIEPEIHTANPLTSEPHLFVTSFPNYQIAARAYENRATDKHEVTPEIAALANRLTKNLQGTEAKARALYNWVSQNIRYVGVYFGAGGVVPHQAAETLANLYGDCKDHATLLQTLLKAIGINSSTALIYNGYQYQHQKIASMDAFNHAITYIPELDLFVDSTAEVAPFGTLPQSETESPALITQTGEIRTTPKTGPDTTFVYYESKVKYDQEGHAESEIIGRYHGEASLFLRHYTQRETPERLIENLMRTYSLSGSGTIDPGQPKNLDIDQTTKLKLKLNDQLVVPGPAGLAIPETYGFYSLENFPHFIVTLKDNLTKDFVCTATPIRTKYTLTLPKNVHILAIPKNVEINKEDVHYQATYYAAGQTILIEREFRFTPPHNACSPADATRLKPIMRELIKDLKSQIVYQPR